MPVGNSVSDCFPFVLQFGFLVFTALEERANPANRV